MTSAPQSASWRTAVGPARWAVRSMTVNPLSGRDGVGMVDTSVLEHVAPIIRLDCRVCHAGGVVRRGWPAHPAVKPLHEPEEALPHHFGVLIPSTNRT